MWFRKLFVCHAKKTRKNKSNAGQHEDDALIELKPINPIIEQRYGKLMKKARQNGFRQDRSVSSAS